MNEFEIMYLRFLQAKREFPNLNHQPEHGPMKDMTEQPLIFVCGDDHSIFAFNKRDICDSCEREFNRSI
jgi:hypothetical protein